MWEPPMPLMDRLCGSDDTDGAESDISVVDTGCCIDAVVIMESGSTEMLLR